jgi:4'-phosphopantetheinyl transferase
MDIPGLAFRGEEEVHVWIVDLLWAEAQLSLLEGSLGQDERARCRRFLFIEDRRRFACAHGALRAVLGAYIGARPADLRFGHGPCGKPHLTEPTVDGRVGFNLSHSREMAVIAVSPGREVGIDVEKLRAIPEMDLIAERYFSGEERAALASDGAWTREEAFFRVWTRREAAAKARGLDLSTALSGVPFPLYPSGGGACITLGGAAWSLRDLPLPSPHVAAVCAEGATCRPVTRRFELLPLRP